MSETYVFPDLLKFKSEQQIKLENNEFNSEKLKDITSLNNNYILIDGAEQSGKTSLCNMLFLHYEKLNYLPVLLNGSDIKGKADINKLIEKQFRVQFNTTSIFDEFETDFRILLIDDIDANTANEHNLKLFIESIKSKFEVVIIFIDKLLNLSNRSTEHDYFSEFDKFSIQKFGHLKRDEFIKKCISQEEKTPFDITNDNQVARLDRDTKHINTIIGSNIVPSYPIFIATIFHTVEASSQTNYEGTSYGHCYHAMITLNLDKLGLKQGGVSACFNFLTKLSYDMFINNLKSVPRERIDTFEKEYCENFIAPPNIVKKLESANILREKESTYDFQYIYIYYYFVGKYFAENINEPEIEVKLNEMLSNLHLKENANIIIFITHHTANLGFLEDIMLRTMVIFDQFKETTLSGESKTIIKDLSDNLNVCDLLDSNHHVAQERENRLVKRDKLEKRDIKETRIDEDKKSDPLLIEIRKAAKSMEIIGQILKNQFGSFKKDKVQELFQVGQDVGLRLLKSFITLIVNDGEQLEESIQRMLDKAYTDKGRELSQTEKEKICQKFIAHFSYGVVFGWLHKIVDCLGYCEIIDIANEVNNSTNTVASKLINLSINSWDNKKLDVNNLKTLYKEFDKDKNHLAIYFLKDIVSKHIYMHRVNYQDKQSIDNLLGFSVKKQIYAQKSITK